MPTVQSGSSFQKARSFLAFDIPAEAYFSSRMPGNQSIVIPPLRRCAWHLVYAVHLKLAWVAGCRAAWRGSGNRCRYRKLHRTRWWQFAQIAEAQVQAVARTYGIECLACNGREHGTVCHHLKLFNHALRRKKYEIITRSVLTPQRIARLIECHVAPSNPQITNSAARRNDGGALGNHSCRTSIQPRPGNRFFSLNNKHIT